MENLKRILSDDEFRAIAIEKGPEELADAMLELRREGRIQLYDDGSGDILVVPTPEG